MQIVIGGIIGSLVVIAIGIWFLVLTDTTFEIVEKETIHPCQKLVLESIELTLQSPWSDIIKNAPLTKEEADAWGKSQIEKYGSMTELQKVKQQNEYLKKNEEVKQQFIASDCIDLNGMHIKGNWLTEEFIGKMKQKIFQLTGKYPNW